MAAAVLGRQFSYGVGFGRFHLEPSNKPITLIPLSRHSVTGHGRLVMTIKVDATSAAARVAGLFPSDGDGRTVPASRLDATSHPRNGIRARVGHYSLKIVFVPFPDM